MIEQMNVELARVRAGIADLQRQEAEIVTALRVVARLGARPAPAEETVDYCGWTDVEPVQTSGSSSAAQLARPSTSAEAIATATATVAWLDNTGVLDVDAVHTTAMAIAPEANAEPVPRLGFKRGEGEASEPLLAELKAEAIRRGMTIQAVSIAIWNNKARIYQLTKCPTVRKATADRIRAWLDGKVPPAAEARPVREPEPTLPPAPAPEPSIAPFALLREIRAFCDERGVAPARFGRFAVGDPKLPGRLEHAVNVRAETVAKVRSLIADPPAALFELLRPPKPQVPRPLEPQPNGRDPTQKPDTPLMDLADRQRLNGQRYHANMRRGQEREATERLDAGKPARNSFERTTMAAIEQRREVEHRQTDPVEQARLALQRKGRVVHSMIIHGGRKDRFLVGGQRDPRTGRLKEHTPAELIALAEEVTGQTFRRSAA